MYKRAGKHRKATATPGDHHRMLTALRASAGYSAACQPCPTARHPKRRQHQSRQRTICQASVSAGGGESADSGYARGGHAVRDPTYLSVRLDADVQTYSHESWLRLGRTCMVKWLSGEDHLLLPCALFLRSFPHRPAWTGVCCWVPPVLWPIPQLLLVGFARNRPLRKIRLLTQGTQPSCHSAHPWHLGCTAILRLPGMSAAYRPDHYRARKIWNDRCY